MHLCYEYSCYVELFFKQYTVKNIIDQEVTLNYSLFRIILENKCVVFDVSQWKCQVYIWLIIYV